MTISTISSKIGPREPAGSGAWTCHPVFLSVAAGAEGRMRRGHKGQGNGSGLNAQQRNLQRGGGGPQGFVERRERRRAPQREFEISRVIERQIEAVGEA